VTKLKKRKERFYIYVYNVTTRELEVIKNVNKNTEYKSEFSVHVWRQPEMDCDGSRPADCSRRAVVRRRRRGPAPIVVRRVAGTMRSADGAVIPHSRPGRYEVCRYSWHSAASLGWPFPVLNRQLCITLHYHWFVGPPLLIAILVVCRRRRPSECHAN